MGRENQPRLHCKPPYYRDSYGFTLLELLIVVSVVMVLIGAAAPSFSSLIESEKVRRLATELEWLMVQAKSEAVMRGSSVVMSSNSVPEIGSTSTLTWTITATDTVTNTILSQISGEPYRGVDIYRTFNSENIFFDPLTGRPNKDGSYAFSIDGQQEVKVSIRLMTGRVFICGESGAYGYAAC
ncbi:pilus assembly FimT family protein [Photobacterium minamisatsumaniensis]|uniref:pilus assembly FimT family protein n=1 Tax=Photobacterium minamisatsumaniensis TaxID=2910233 RepID=UPI003D0F4595